MRGGAATPEPDPDGGMGGNAGVGEDAILKPMGMCLCWGWGEPNEPNDGNSWFQKRTVFPSPGPNMKQ